MRRIFFLAGGALLVGALALFVLGSARYGGPRGLLLRVRSEFVAQQPREAFVPTPLPTASRPAPASPATATATRTSTSLPSPTAAIADMTRTPVEEVQTATPSPTLIEPTPTPAVLLAMDRPYVELTGLTHVWQTWNNCGPATLSMYLSYWGSTSTQEDLRLIVRPNPEDKHAGADELAAAARAEGLNAMVRVDGTAETLRQLVSNGVPVMASTWHEDEPGDGLGHYRLVVGYDDAAQVWLLYDSLAATAADRNAPYEPLRMAYDTFESWWEVFNRRYVVIYSNEFSAAVQAILAEDMDDGVMWEGALANVQGKLADDPNNPFHWFNLGTNLVALERYDEAASAYDQARQLGLPWRMLWYQFGPFPAYFQVGRYQEVVALADATLAVTTHLEELHYWRGLALDAMGDTPAAIRSLERAIQLRPNYPEAVEALGRLRS
jgi:hypothetical protein